MLFFFKQKTAYEIRLCDWSSDVCSSDLIDDVWAKLALGEEPAGLLYAVNRDFADRGRALEEGDEVALIPPVSGGAFRLSGEPLDLQAAVAEVAGDDAGAVATFVGTVRRSSRGRDVLYLEYEAFEEMAEPMLVRLADELKAKHDLCEVAIHHRLGRVEIGERRVGKECRALCRSRWSPYH